ncbi:hypothetical protein DVA67_003715 [Solirubrobacter sp. CPCC 204708]|uniref:Uncharacterized protein n=1 Tax=Solirubrobacter deserti TaxID=2282478 RepID=A0ABT4RU35_9ACTN|nr:hypothetical protein [Solirubrobacter deserti]MBE2315068.1 hypothetical protein [Solirubrobacter deserti]MDA0141898.1 hypothetical protein [Solirubrobacter deserti]
MLPCGPADVDELARTAHTRVYRHEGEVRGCHRGRASFTLGQRVVRVYVRGRFAAVQRKVGEREALRVYDLRARRPRGDEDRARRFVAIRFSAGTAVYLAEEPDGTTTVSDTGEGYYGHRAAGTSFLAFKGTVIATGLGNQFSFSGLKSGGKSAPNGRLITHGSIRVDVRNRNLLVAGHGERPPIRLGTSIGECSSPGDCEGIGGVQIAGDRFLGASYGYARQGGYSDVTIHDLVAGTQRKLCVGMTRYVLGDSGRVACSDRTPLGAQIRVEDVVLEENERVDPDSLERRGDQLVWRTGGVERTAPLP